MRRRSILTTVACTALAVTFFWPGLARAVDPQAASGLVKQAVQEAMDQFAGKTLAREETRRQLEQMVDRYVDRRQIAEAILGRYWTRASAEQQTKFQKLVFEYALSAFGGGMTDMSAQQKITVTGTAVDGDRVTVHSVSTEPGEDPSPIDWVVGAAADGRAIVVDVFIDGVSPIKTMHDDFLAVLHGNGGSVDGLMVAMQKKIDANKAANNSSAAAK